GRLPKPPASALFSRFVAPATAELDDLIAAGAFGHEERTVGAVEHGLGTIAGLHFSDAKAGGAVFSPDDGLRQIGKCQAHLLRRSRRRRAVAIGAQYNEFFASISGDQIARMRTTFEQLGKTFDDFVAGLMPVRVVDLLEAIDIAHDQTAGQAALAVG